MGLWKDGRRRMKLCELGWGVWIWIFLWSNFGGDFGWSEWVGEEGVEEMRGLRVAVGGDNRGLC